MCSIASYTEKEKRDQVVKVLELLDSPINTEAQKKNLLYNLAFMNNMVVKGYHEVRTEMDDVIYSVKNHAIREIARLMPKRCSCTSDVIYIYANKRQYSFHYRGTAPCEYRYVSWDRVKDGWSLSDKEYQRQANKEKKRIDNIFRKSNADHQERIRKEKLLAVHAVNEARKIQEDVTKFWKTLEEKLSKTQKKSKAYQQRNLERCWHLWAKKFGFPLSCPRPWLSIVSSLDKSPYAIEFYNRMVSLHIISDFSSI